MRTFKSIITAVLLTSATGLVSAYSQDYERHLELNFLFYEAQRSGKLPENNRIPWRGDSGLTHGSDVGYDLTGGYYDAGDNVKFNFPQAFTMTVMAWGALDFADGYRTSGQMKYAKDAIKWGTDYLMKCHPADDKFFMQVGDGDIDHQYWKAVEDIDYEMPSFMLSSKAGGSEVSAETAAALAAASILFKKDDPKYSEKLLDQAIEWFTFANTYRADYHLSVPKVTSYYKSWGGYNDELGWGAAWLYRATGDKAYLDIAVSQAKVAVLELTAMDWDDKYPALAVFAYQLTKDSELAKRIDSWITECIDNGTYTPGGLYWNRLSDWGSNRRSSALAANFAFYAKTLDKSNPIREKITKFGKSQADYIQGKNPKNIDYVVGADETSPRSVHHRTASGADCCECEPLVNKHILYGALAGGPGENDEYEDDRTDYRMNEVALDYNVGYCSLLAYLIGEGLNVPDPKSTWEYAYKSTLAADKKEEADKLKEEQCWASKYNRPCCKHTKKVAFRNSKGKWGFEKGRICGIVPKKETSSCWAESLGYKCCKCKNCRVRAKNAHGKWSIENGKWCGIKA